MKKKNILLRYLIIPFVVWLAIGLLLNIFRFELFVLVFVFSFFWYLGGGVLGVVFIKLFWNRYGPALALAIPVIYILAGFLVWFYGVTVAYKIRFEFQRSSYEEVVKELYSDREQFGSERFYYGNILGEIDPGPPLRVVFPWPGGILDNWCGVVYDPTDKVKEINSLKSDRSNQGDPKLQDVMFLFGGTMYRANPLGGHWYLCWFT